MAESNYVADDIQSSLELAGFKHVRKLVDGPTFVISSARRVRDDKDVILKILRFERPSADLIAMLYHEYEVGKELNSPSIIHIYELIDQQNLYGLVLENIHGVSLRQYLKEHPIGGLEELLQLCIQMTHALGEVHKNHIIHKDVKPDNFIISDPSVLKITDFNCASKLPRERQEAVSPQKLEGTLMYMAPEQTGRMNSRIDYRSDFYALGITFFEICTGHLPYASNDFLELVHAHLSRPLPPMRHSILQLPEVLEQIVQKLAAKNPRERYQSAIGVQMDLEQCLQQLRVCGRIDSFAVGQMDLCDRLNLSEKLYGRQEDIKALLAAYEHVSLGGVELVAVSGLAGIGKTKLINELPKAMAKESGYFISGKFDQLQRNMPYMAIRQAFDQLVRLILMRPEEEFTTLKQAIAAKLGSAAKSIIDLVPDLEQIMGPQPEVPQLTPIEQNNRLQTKFKEFLQTIATPKHPLVIFIDDLQWIDSSSLRVFESIMSDPELKHLLLIVAYRNSEIDGPHPLNRFLEAMKAHERPFTAIELAPLELADFEAFLLDTFQSSSTATKELAALIYKRTQGNPFFCKQLISSLYKDQLLYFDYSKRGWDWNLEKIAALQIADNVVQFVLAKLLELPTETFSLLQSAACLGNRFSIAMLSLVSGLSAEDIGKKIWPALQEEVIVALHLDYKRLDALRDKALSSQLAADIAFQFIHDRVQQAVYQSIPAEEKQSKHLAIARLLLEREPESCQHERLYEVTDHLNRAHALLDDPLKVTAAQLNYQAGLGSERANAYTSMRHYLEAGLSLIDDSLWKTNYAYSFAYRLGLARSLYFTADIPAATIATKDLEKHAKSAIDKASIYRMQYLTSLAQGNVPLAMELALKCLKVLGIHVPLYPTRAAIYYKLFQVKLAMRRHNIENIEQELDAMKDQKIIYAFQMIYELTMLATWFPGDFWVYLCLVSTQLMLRYGRPPGFQLCACIYSGIMLVLTSNLDYVLFLVRDAEKPTWSSNNNFTDAITLQIVGYGFIHLVYPMKNSLNYLQQATLKGMESGNINLTGNCLSCIALTQLGIAKSLKDFRNAAEEALVYCRNHSVLGRVQLCQFLGVISSDLMARETHPAAVEKVYDGMLKSKNYLDYARSPMLMAWYYFFIESYAAASECHFKWFVEEERLRYYPFTFTQKTIDALSLFNTLQKLPWREKVRYRWRFEKLCRDIAWIAQKNPHNYLHQHLILTGVKAHHRKNHFAAVQSFEKAAENARKGDFYMWVAIANELAGQLYAELSQVRFAKTYIQDAHYYYHRYGMLAKVEALEKRYPNFFKESPHTARGSSIYPSKFASLNTSSYGSTASYNTSSVGFDFLSVIKASQTISGEIVSERLFERMLHIVVENAGADKALFLEQNNQVWFAVALLEVHPTGEQFTNIDLPLSAFKEMSSVIFQLALRSKTPVIFNCATDDSQLAHDPYILRKRPKSILCLPVIHSNKMVGMIYLENTLTADVFTQERVTVLTTLASQIAISLENSHYLSNMQQLYRKTERFVPQQFLHLLGKDNISDVKLGDSIQLDVTAMFADIRNFTSLSEKLEPKRLSKLLNIYLGYMGPPIRSHNGFVEHFLGDGILALFPGSADEAVSAALEMQQAFIEFNKAIQAEGYDTIEMGIGLNHGTAMLTILGELERLDANVVSDAINTASRIEGLNKLYGTNLLISDAVYDHLQSTEKYLISLVDTVRVKGKSLTCRIYQVFQSPQGAAERKKLLDYIAEYTSAFDAYERGDFSTAISLLNSCLEKNNHDSVARLLLARCQSLQASGVPDNWSATVNIFEKNPE